MRLKIKMITTTCHGVTQRAKISPETSASLQVISTSVVSCSAEQTISSTAFALHNVGIKGAAQF
jgi:hypothetical protein